METNASIIGRQVIAFDDHKVIGPVQDIAVGQESLSVDYLIITSKSTKSPLALPFDSIIAIGDTFVTVAEHNDAVSCESTAVKSDLRNAVELIGVPTFTKTGNKLAIVESFEFNSATGKIEKIILDDKSEYSAESYLFFTSDYVFFDDGSSTSADIRENSKAKPSKSDKSSRAKKAVKPVVNDDDEEEVRKTSDEDATLKRWLIGQRLNDTVTSADGEFTVQKGTSLTKELLDLAEDHDALVLLTMSIDA